MYSTTVSTKFRFHSSWTSNPFCMEYFKRIFFKYTVFVFLMEFWLNSTKFGVLQLKTKFILWCKSSCSVAITM